MLIISDIDGTISDDRHRKDLFMDNKLKYYQLMHLDPINNPGLELINEIKSSDPSQEPIVIFLTTRPRSYVHDDGQVINVSMKTRNWLLTKKISYNQVISKDLLKGPIEGKINKLVKIVLDNMNDKNIYYLEDDPLIAAEAKERCPMVHVFLVTYEGYEEIQERQHE